MENLMLAAEDFDWIQAIVVLGVFVFSALGSIAKKLIEKFTPEETDKSGRKMPKRRPEKPRRVAPAHPVAKSLPPQPRPTTPTARPVGRKPPRQPVATPRSREVVQPPITAAPPPAPVRPPRRPTQEPVTPTHGEQPVPRRRVARKRKARPAERARKTVAVEPPSKERAKGREPFTLEAGAAEPSFAEVHKTADRDALDVHAAAEQDFLDAHIGAPGSGAAPMALRRAIAQGWLTKQALRHAIVMREVLGSPLGLRPPMEPF